MIIPMRVRTARAAHRCDGYPRCSGIQPGEQYEDWRLPPGRDINTGTRWWKVKVHHPASPDGGGPAGCELAAACRENARWNARASQWVTAAAPDPYSAIAFLAWEGLEPVPVRTIRMLIRPPRCPGTGNTARDREEGPGDDRG